MVTRKSIEEMGIPVIEIDIKNPASVDALVEALGISPGDSVQIMTPQFDRVDGTIPSQTPGIEFDKLHTYSKAQLLDMGMRNWDERLWLIPGEWHAALPAGMTLECIDGEQYVVGTDYIDDDIRFGMLAYGVVPNFTRMNGAVE